jgi:hypothetical protein
VFLKVERASANSSGVPAGVAAGFEDEGVEAAVAFVLAVWFDGALPQAVKKERSASETSASLKSFMLSGTPVRDVEFIVPAKSARV